MSDLPLEVDVALTILGLSVVALLLLALGVAWTGWIQDRFTKAEKNDD